MVNAREVAMYVLTNLKPTHAKDNYKYLDGRYNKHGLAFKPEDNGKLPKIIEIQLTKRTRFFRTDLEVYIVKYNQFSANDILILEVFDFDGDLFDKVYDQYFIDIKNNKLIEEENKNKDFAKAIKNMMED